MNVVSGINGALTMTRKLRSQSFSLVFRFFAFSFVCLVALFSIIRHCQQVFFPAVASLHPSIYYIAIILSLFAHHGQ